MQLSIRLCLLLIISIGAALSTLTHANNTFWEDQSNQDSFLGLPANAEISDLNLKIIKQSAKYVYVLISGRVKAAISESSLQSKQRKFVSELEIYEDDFLGENLISKHQTKITLPYKGKTGKLVKMSVYEGKFGFKIRVKLSQIKSKLGPFDKPILKAKFNVFERISKETKKSNKVKVNLNPKSNLKEFYSLESYKVSDERRKQTSGKFVTISEARLKIFVRGKEFFCVAEGNGPINALDIALRKALSHSYPKLVNLNLIDYKVRILTPQDGTNALVRVRIESSNHKYKWSTIGVSYNVVDASYIALHDSITYHLLKS